MQCKGPFCLQMYQTYLTRTGSLNQHPNWWLIMYQDRGAGILWLAGMEVWMTEMTLNPLQITDRNMCAFIEMGLFFMRIV